MKTFLEFNRTGVGAGLGVIFLDTLKGMLKRGAITPSEFKIVSEVWRNWEGDIVKFLRLGLPKIVSKKTTDKIINGIGK